MGKTPEYTKKAIADYRKKHDQLNVLLPVGYKDIIKERATLQGLSINAYIKILIDADINK